MTQIDHRALRQALLAGAVVGAVVGMVSSQPLRASAPRVADATATQSCAGGICENMTWLRAPVRYRTTASR